MINLKQSVFFFHFLLGTFRKSKLFNMKNKLSEVKKQSENSLTESFIYFIKIEHIKTQMLSLIKSFGSRAISSIPTLGSKTKIQTPQDPNLEDRLKQISNQILKAQVTQQFKIYQQLQSAQNSNFNRNLRTIYEHEGCKTEVINSIIRFFTFLLTNCKNELVICKLVSQPLVIQLTKIVLHSQGNEDEKDQQFLVLACLKISKNQHKNEGSQNITSCQEKFGRKQSPVESLGSLGQPQNDTTELKQKERKTPKQLKSLHYLHDIDWDEVNVYKVALIRSYINCLNAQTINYMIVDNQLPIFVNCINGYKHYLSDGVEGTCISNCILMILTKVNHIDQVCQIILDSQHSQKTINTNQERNRQSLSKSISNQKSIKLRVFVKQVIKRIGLEMGKVLQFLSYEAQKTEDCIQRNLKQFRKLQVNMQFIESNTLFCMDLINTINNSNYTAKIKQNIGESIETQLIGRLIEYVQEQRGPVTGQEQSRFQLIIIKLIRFVLNLSIVCQKEQKIIQFLNKNSIHILENIVSYCAVIFGTQLKKQVCQVNQQNDVKMDQSLPTSKAVASHVCLKECLTYLCNFSFILLKQTISPFSKLSSRKILQINQQVVSLKLNILRNIFTLLQQITKSELLKEGICFKCIRNILLCIFYLTIKEDRCTLTTTSQNNKQKALELDLQFKFNILTLHKIFVKLFKKTFIDNKNWQYIVNNYQNLMRQIPSTILQPQENDKFCHFHNGNNCHKEDEVRNRIIICEAVRNYRYMIIHETKLQDRHIRLQNIYHKHFLSPGWNYHHGEKIKFNSPEEYKIVCMGFLQSNGPNKLPIEIIQDFQCLIIGHKLSEYNYQVIANIRYKKINSFVPEGKNLIRMKLINIQELILEFSSAKTLTTFKQYLNENRNKTRQKQLKFINYYLNLYLKDSQKLIQQMYTQELVSIQVQSPQKNQDLRNPQTRLKKLSLQNIQIESFESLTRDQIPEQNISQQKTQQKQEIQKEQYALLQYQEKLNIMPETQKQLTN